VATLDEKENATSTPHSVKPRGNIPMESETLPIHIKAAFDRVWEQPVRRGL